MSRSLPEWIGKDHDTPVPPRVRARVFLAHDGICHISKRRIRAGEPWECDHVTPLIKNGENRESNLAPALKDKHREKTDGEVADKSKEATIRGKHLGIIKPKGSFSHPTLKRTVDGRVVSR